MLARGQSLNNYELVKNFRSVGFRKAFDAAGRLGGRTKRQDRVLNETSKVIRGRFSDAGRRCEVPASRFLFRPRGASGRAA